MSTSGVIDPYAVRVTTGSLVTCDSAAKQILLHIDSMRDGPNKFILRDVDDTHVLVKTANLEQIKDLLQDELEKNTYVQDPNL
ncbi:hypothetical protein JCM24511_05877 [Saitozyma sp. JCM 24511]|uniref:General transcription and DNA repair factor IIH subunit TFB5 n=1 Tax=Saitozyma podzolica TaxID=1890683 RepID=A0A427Y2C5_9TREE|nr:hypothetical protein EHS25_005059 [Saitozyma podzolica]GFZ48129.1 hypothetical protein JCM24511_05877 [Saitozyma sp. JCM 24511]